MFRLAAFGMFFAVYLLSGCSSSSGPIISALPPDGGTPSTPTDSGTPSTPTDSGTPSTPTDSGTPSTPTDGVTPTTNTYADFGSAVLFAETLFSSLEGESIVRAADVPQSGSVNYQGAVALFDDTMVGSVSIDIDFSDFGASRGIADNFIVPVFGSVGSPYVDGSLNIKNFVVDNSVVEGVSYGSFTADADGVLGFSDVSEIPEEFQISGELSGSFAGLEANVIKGQGSFTSSSLSCDGPIDVCGGGTGTAVFAAISN